MLIKTNSGNLRSELIDGVSYETLDDESLDMLAAAKTGTLGTFLIEHPQFIAKSG